MGDFYEQFEIDEAEFHRQWTAAVGTPGYDKSEWTKRYNEHLRRWRNRADQVGIGGPLLRPAATRP